MHRHIKNLLHLLIITFSSCKVVHTTSLVADVREGSSSAFDTYSFNAVGHEGAFCFAATNSYDAPLLKYDGEQVEPITVQQWEAMPVSSLGSFRALQGAWEYGIPPEVLGKTDVAHAFPNIYMETDGSVVFIARDPEKGQEPHLFDGHELSVIDIWPGRRGSSPSWFYLLNDQIFFNARDSLRGTELWVYHIYNDQLKLKDLSPEAGNSYPAFFSTYQNNLIFSASGPGTGREPVIFDGNEFRFIDVIPGTSGSSPFYYKAFKDDVCFIAKDSIHGRELHVYNGAEAKMVADFNAGAGDGTPRPDFRASYEAAVYKDALYFMGDDGQHGKELLKFDGKSIEMVQDILPGPEGSDPKWLTLFEGKLFFTADDGMHGEELWVYDGKQLEMMKDIRKGSDGSYPNFLRVYEDRIYYTADDGLHGRELWIVDVE